MEKVKQSRCIISIKGKMSDPSYPVDIWLDSLKSLANVLLKENQQRLKVAVEQQPRSMTGRALRYVCPTLNTMKKHKIIEISSNGAHFK